MNSGYVSGKVFDRDDDEPVSDYEYDADLDDIEDQDELDPMMAEALEDDGTYFFYFRIKTLLNPVSPSLLSIPSQLSST